ncbi:hypothetical protein HW561_20610 [Rhodobacteraceae bacterium B1Z28]|uniref:Uncharacterized protein n=1 Tax=Ruegeria haliotis TaxID=2747601 RepID=A0ABX2PWN5_9RHOB|nr:hypothetical protein [Ruegeria haliotis]
MNAFDHAYLSVLQRLRQVRIEQAEIELASVLQISLDKSQGQIRALIAPENLGSTSLCRFSNRQNDSGFAGRDVIGQNRVAKPTILKQYRLPKFIVYHGDICGRSGQGP